MEVMHIRTYLLSLGKLMEIDFLLFLKNYSLRSFKGIKHATYL